MTISEMIEGLRIMAKYSKHGEDEHLAGADHDKIHGPLDSDAEITPEDRTALEALGWFADDESGVWMHFA